MQETMEHLVELQQIEDEIREMLVARHKLEAQSMELTAETEKSQKVLDKLTDELKVAEKEKRELQETMAQGQDKIKKSEKRLPDIRTPKEYMAVMKEIDAAKKANHEVQEKVKLKETVIEAMSQEKDESEITLGEIQAKTEELSLELSPQIAQYEKKLKAKTKSRDTLLKNLPSSLKKRYQILLEQRGGVAVVEARSCACLGCNMRLPPQFFNSLHGSSEIKSCPHCNRFLFVREKVNA